MDKPFVSHLANTSAKKKKKLPFDREPSPERKNPYKIETPPPTPARKLARKGTMSSPAIQTGPTLGPTSSMREFAEAAKKAKAVKNAALNSKKRKTEAVDDGQHNEAKKRKVLYSFRVSTMNEGRN